MRKFALYFFAAFLLTSCDNLKTKDASNSDEETEETTTKKKKKALDEDEESADEEISSRKKKKTTDDEADYADEGDTEESGENEGWTRSNQNEFMSNCVGEANKSMVQDKAEDYCSCMMGKLQKRYPNPNDVSDLTESDMTRLAKECY